MKHTGFDNIIVAGTGRMASGIVTNLLKAGALVSVLSEDITRDKAYVADMIAGWQLYRGCNIETTQLHYIISVEEITAADLVIVVTAEDLQVKQELIQKMEQRLDAETIIAVNSESFLLEALQADTTHPNRVIGLNWCDPTHLSAFLEIIGNQQTTPGILKRVELWAKNQLDKDPCTVHCGYSVNARLMAALAREAFYLVENGYASVADIDRACRNDAGYYLPFSGNCRYMDLMGTYAYGLVMKDLNRELSKEDHIPAFFSELVEAGKNGMLNREGFYDYEEADNKLWEERFRKFSFEIKEIIDKYPFGYLKEEPKKIASKITVNE